MGNSFMQIKRYVMEFANDKIRQDRANPLMKPEIKKARRLNIERIVHAYKAYRITTDEALQAILNA